MCLRRKQSGAVVVVAALIVMAGCSTAPRSYLEDRQVYHPAAINRYPVVVVAVDHEYYGPFSGFHPLPIEPGNHSILFEARSLLGGPGVQRRYVMQIKPCTRYFVAAQRASRLTEPWDLVVEEVEPVGDCDPASELARANAGASSQSLLIPQNIPAASGASEQPSVPVPAAGAPGAAK